MSGLNAGVAEENKVGENGRSKVMLTESDKKRLFLVAALILVLLAGVSIALGSIHKAPLAACEGIVLLQNRYTCLNNLAISTSNASVCSKLPYPYNDSCVVNVASNTRSIDTCNATRGSAFYSSCVSNISASTSDASYCGLITNSSSSSYCAYRVAQESSFDNVSYCRLMNDAYYASQCYALYYYNRATSSSNATYCTYIQNTTNATVLYALSSNGRAFNYSSFNISESLYLGIINATPRSYCYYKVAVLSKNPALCSLAGGTIGELCTYSLYTHQNTTTNYTNLNASYLCANVPASFKDYCILGVQTAKAANTNNVSVCLAIGVAQEEYSCISTLASRYNESSYCSYISNSTARSACEISATNRTA